LHDFDCVDLTKFREKLSQFPGTLSTSIIRANEDVQFIKSKFAWEFWLASGKEAVKIIARAKLAQVNFRMILLATAYSQVFCPFFPYICFFSFVSWSKKRLAEKALRPLNRLLKMMTRAIREKRIRAVAATMAVMVTELLGTKGTLRRLTSWAKCFAELFASSRLLLYICTFT
jgi:hypothetical protein